MNWDGRIVGDARFLPIANESVQCCVTSPPYWGLRDYNNPGQIGLESTPLEYVEGLRAVFAEVHRVLKSDGVLWLNLGDSYAGSWGAQGRQGASGEMSGRSIVSARQIAVAAKKESRTGSVTHLGGIKAKDLVGIPWMVAFALRSDGWYLRRDIIWNKPNPMPESVTDRPTSSHEYIFLLTKSERYFYDADAIAEPATFAGPNGQQKSPYAQGFSRRTPEEEQLRQDKQRGHGRRHAGFNDRWDESEKERPLTRNKRSVWTVSTKPYTEAHYATFPPEIPETCILAGSKPGDLILDPLTNVQREITCFS